MVVGGSLYTLEAGVHTWRNGGNGQYPDSRPPVEWSDRTGAKWSVPLATTSNSSPILVDGRLIFCREPTTLVAADAETGEILWERSNSYFDTLDLPGPEKDRLRADFAAVDEIAFELRKLAFEASRLKRSLRGADDEEKASVTAKMEAKEAEIAALEEKKRELVSGTPLESIPEEPPTHDTNGYASYTPLADGNRIYAVFGNGVVVCFDLDGRKQWGRYIEPPDHQWGGATSPLLIKNRLIVRFKDFIALNPETGAEIWRTPTQVQFGTPAPFAVEGRAYVFTPMGEVIRVGDGAILSSGLVAAGRKPWAYFNTPAIHGDRIYTVRGDESTDGFAYAFKIPATIRALEEDGVRQIWKTRVAKERYYASPVIIDGLMYAVTRRFDLSVIEADSGTLVYQQRLEGVEGQVYSGLIAANGMTFLSGDEGMTVVLKPGRTYQEIARFESEPFRSTPIISGNTLFVRAYSHLSAYDGE